jgi:hypothetical protein
MEAILLVLVVIFILYNFICLQSNEHLEHLDNLEQVQKFTNLYSQPLDNFTLAMAGPNEYTKKINKNAKQCSDDSLNTEIFDYKLSVLNQTKI